MVCPTCKREVSNNSNICPFCNTPIETPNISDIPNQSQKTLNTLNVNNGFYEILDREDLVNANNIKVINDSEVNATHANNNQDNSANNILNPVVVNANLSNSENLSINLEHISQSSENTKAIEPKEKTIEDSTKESKKNVLFIIGIVLGIIILIIMFVYILLNLAKNESKNNSLTSSKSKYVPPTEVASITNNKGVKSTYNNPLKVGSISLATIYDSVGNNYYEVDVTGIRFIDNLEASQLATTYVNKPLLNGFSWYGFEYKVQFNDLEALNGRKINPVLDAKVYTTSLGNDFVTYEGHNYMLEVTTLSNNVMITNNESTIIRVIYQLLGNKNEYSICLGYRDKTMGCFAES